jgi:hypothetical protein
MLDGKINLGGKLTMEELKQLVKENKLTAVDIESIDENEMILHTGILGICDIELKVKITDTYIFCP